MFTGKSHQDDAAKMIGIFVVIIVAIFAIAVFYSLAATLNVDRATTYLEDNGFVVFAQGDVPKVTLVTPAIDADSATTASPSGLEFITDDLTILRGCSNNQVLKWAEATDIWNCADDSTQAVTGAGAVALDLLDDDANESDALVEIAVTGDANSIFTESADKLLIAVAASWPTADVADALTSDPTDCSANEATTGVNASGIAQGCNTLDGTGLTLAGNSLSADLGTSIVTGEITDDTILEVDLDAVDSAIDEECLTYEDSNSGFEWQTCGGVSAGNPRQIFQTNEAGDGTEFTDNIDVPGTLDVVGGTTLDGTLGVTGAVTFMSTLDVLHTATGVDDHAIEIDHNAAGFGDSKSLSIDYITGTIGAGEEADIIVINIDESASTGGEVDALVVLATEGSANVTALEVGALVNVILQLSGTFSDMEVALSNLADVRASFISTASDVSIFVANGDTVTIADASKFFELEFLLDTEASGAGIKPTFEYSTGIGTWAVFVPIDGTNGLRNTGVVLWDDATIPGWMTGLATKYLIKVTRTAVSLSTPPVEDKVQISATTEFFWNKTGDISVLSLTLSGDLSCTNCIETGDITDDEILEADLDATNSAVDEYCLTFEDDVGGDFEWEVCSSGATLLTTGSDGDSTIVSNDSGLELIGGDLALIRGCGDNQTLLWIEATDTWDCALIALRDIGSDSDSTTTVTASGLEYISGELTLIRGCSDDEFLAWDESSDLWRCIVFSTGITVTGDSVTADLGTAIDTSEITNDTILEIDLDAVDEAVDEECLTYETDNSDFEWQACGDTTVLVNPGVDADSTTTVTASGLEYVSGELTIIRGCGDNQILAWDEGTDVWRCVTVAGTGITVTADTFDVDLGTSITTDEITDDEILEVDLDAVDAANDEECLTFETDNGGFEWQSCSSVSIVDPGSDADSSTTITASGLEFISGDLTLLRGCANNQVLVWNESTDTWDCNLLSLRDIGSDADSTTTTTGSGLEYIDGDLTIIRGCSDNEVLAWDESTDQWRCVQVDGDGITVTGDIFVVDLGTAIDTSEITDDTILEADLNLVDTPNDEECLTYETDGGGDFEWQVCGTTLTLVSIGSDGDSTTTVTASGLEFIDGNLTIIRGCSDDEFLGWDESTDVWRCIGVDTGLTFSGDTLDATLGTSIDTGEITDDTILEVDLDAVDSAIDEECLTYETDNSGFEWQSCSGTVTVVNPGSDGDSTTTVTASGLEFISGELTIIRGCADEDALVWIESTDVWQCTDIEEETHATEHIDGGDDELEVEDLATACTINQFFQADGSLNVDCKTLVAGDISDQNAGTDITADLEEENHCSEHSSVDLTCATETLIFAVDSIDLAEIVQTNTLGGDPAFLVDECWLVATATGGGMICEGSTADGAEQLYLFPDVNGSDTTSRIVVDNTQVISVDGTGLTINAGILEADLGTAIVTGEITDDTILEEDLDLVDTPNDEECLTFESDGGGDFEWEVCGGSITLVNPGADADSTTTVTASGLEQISGELTLIRGCSDDEVLIWDESTDVWRCGTLAGDGLTVTSDTLAADLGTAITTGEITDDEILEVDLDAVDEAGDEECLTYETDNSGFEWQSCGSTVTVINPGSDADSTTTVTASGLEIIGGDLTLIRGCADDEVLAWDESTDVWRCITISGTGLTVTTDTLSVDLGDSIETGEITDDEILEVDLDVVDSATDEECLTFETDNGGFEWQDCNADIVTGDITDDTILEVDLDLVDSAVDEECLTYEIDNLGFEWQACGDSPTLVNPGSNNDSTTTVTASGLEDINGELTIIRGCSDDELLAWDESSDVWRCVTVAGTGLTVTGDTFNVDLGTSITTDEITDDEILEVDLDAVDSAVDEECLTFETDNSGFEWQACSTLVLVSPGTDSDSTTTVTASGLETIDGNLTIIRGCADDQVLAWDEGTDVWRCITYSTGLTVTGDNVTVDLGTTITTGEITDDEILEADLDAVDSANDEECLTYEVDNLGFEWQSCGSTVTVVNPGVDADSTTTVTASGLELIGGNLTIIRGCSDDEVLGWDESTDVWRCISYGTGLTVTGDIITVDLGTTITTDEITDDEILPADLDIANGEVDEECLTFETDTSNFEWEDCNRDVVTGDITDDTILEEDLDAVDTPTDEECLTFETDNSGFEWQSCGTILTLVNPGSDSDSTTTVTASGLEDIGGSLTIIRGCSDDEVLGWDESSDVWRCITVGGDGLTFTGDTLDVDLGTAIDTSEITDDTILEVDLDLVDSANDEECLTYESGGGGDFEWQVCSSISLVNPGADADSTTTVTASGLESIGGELTIIRGCSDNEVLSWDEGTDVWRCVTFSTGFTVTGDNITVDLGVAITTDEITDDEILEEDLDVIDADVAGDEECLTFESDATGDFEWQDCNAGIVAADIGDLNASTDITADLEEELHCAEHSSADLDCSGETLVFAADSVETGEINDGTILEADLSAIDVAGDEECLTSEGTGFEWQDCSSIILVNPGSDADSTTTVTASGLELVGGSLTIIRGCSDDEVLGWDESTDVWRCVSYSTGLTVTGDNITIDLGVNITTDEIVDDEILEADLDAVDSANDEECLTFETDNSGFEWQSCSGTVTVVNPGADSDSTTTVTASGLENIGGSLTIIRGCNDNELLVWTESTDVWGCGEVPVLTSGTDGDSAVASADGGLELIGGELTLIRGCDDDEVLAWDESNDLFRCVTYSTGLTVTGDSVTVDLGIAIDSAEITNDVILEIDLNATDEAVDEECLTFESPGFEWQACGGSTTLVNPGADADSTTTVTASGLELIGGELTIIRGCSDDEVLLWDESSDVWRCGLLAGDGLTVTGDTLSVDLGTAIDTSEITNDTILEIDLSAVDEAGDEECLTYESPGFEWQSCSGSSLVLVNPGSDGDSTTTVTASGLEFIGGELTLLRGCANNGSLVWIESTDTWDCATNQAFETITDGAGSIVADSTGDTLTIATSGNAVDVLIDAGTDTLTIEVDPQFLFEEKAAIFVQTGDVDVALDIENIRIYNIFGHTATIQEVSCWVNTAGTSTAITIDVNKNGTTIFTTQGGRPSIAASSNFDTSDTPDVTTFADGDYLQIEIDASDSGDTGADLTCSVNMRIRIHDTAS